MMFTQILKEVTLAQYYSKCRRVYISIYCPPVNRNPFFPLTVIQVI